MALRGSADLEATRRREFRRTVIVSGGAHLGAVARAGAFPAPAAVRPAGVITVDLVAAPPSAAPAPAAPKPAEPAPAAPPKPKPRKPKQTVLPKESTDRATKPKPAKKKPAPRREEVFPDERPKEQKSLDDLMAEMRGESGEPTPKPVETATARTPSPASGPGVPVSPQVRDWMRRTKVHVQRAWVVAPGFRMQDLETHVVVDLDAAGNVRGTEIARRSGNPWYDEGVVRGIEKASPLPAPPKAGEWPFVFKPEDAF